MDDPEKPRIVTGRNEDRHEPDKVAEIESGDAGCEPDQLLGGFRAVEGDEAGEEAHRGEGCAFEDDLERRPRAGNEIAGHICGKAENVENVAQGPGSLLADDPCERRRQDADEGVEPQAGKNAKAAAKRNPSDRTRPDMLSLRSGDDSSVFGFLPLRCPFFVIVYKAPAGPDRVFPEAS